MLSRFALWFNGLVGDLQNLWDWLFTAIRIDWLNLDVAPIYLISGATLFVVLALVLIKAIVA